MVVFSFTTCPVGILQAPAKGKRVPPDEMKARWGAPIVPKLTFKVAAEDLADFLRQGLAVRYRQKSSEESPSPSLPRQPGAPATDKPRVES
jgi:hypothetical protein